MGDFRMPALGAGMDVGRIIAWHVAPGDTVARGDIVALVETDKANIDVEVFESGVVEELLVPEGTKVAVGTPLARIGTGVDLVPAGLGPLSAPSVTPSGDQVSEAAVAAVAQPVPAAAAAVPAAPAAVAPPPAPVRGGGFARSPLVRRQARTQGVDLTTVHGTGPDGEVTRHDVGVIAVASDRAGVRSSPYARRLAAERGLAPAGLAGVAATGPDGAIVARDVPTPEPATPVSVGYAGAGTPPEPTAPAPAPAAAAATPGATDERTLAMRLAIARAMERSNREIPHYYLGETVDVEATLHWLTARNSELPPAKRILPAALVLKATALALREYPDLNGYWIDDAFQRGPGVHIGVAINLRRGGLLAPAIRDVDQLPLDELMAALADLVQRTRAGGLKGSELTDPTITVSNLGDTGVESIQGVITPPQVALVGVGRITERPWAVDGLLAVRRTLFLSLAGDHRASDGHRGGRFLAAIAANLGRPETL